MAAARSEPTRHSPCREMDQETISTNAGLSARRCLTFGPLIHLAPRAMQTYFVRRVGIAANASELDAALTRLRTAEYGQRTLDAQWLHSYALREANGRLGLACVFVADSVSTLLHHAERNLLPAAEVLVIAKTLCSRPFEPTQALLVRRRACWCGPADGDPAWAFSRQSRRGQAAHGVKWLHSYVVDEIGGARGTWCLYRAVDGGTLQRHAASVGLPIDDAVPVLGRIVFRDEPSARLLPGPTRPDRSTPLSGDCS